MRITWSYVNGTREDFEEMASPDKALFVGSPQQVIEKILYQHELFGHKRFIAQIDIGGIPFEKNRKRNRTVGDGSRSCRTKRNVQMIPERREK